MKKATQHPVFSEEVIVAQFLLLFPSDIGKLETGGSFLPSYFSFFKGSATNVRSPIPEFGFGDRQLAGEDLSIDPPFKTFLVRVEVLQPPPLHFKTC